MRKAHPHRRCQSVRLAGLALIATTCVALPVGAQEPTSSTTERPPRGVARQLAVIDAKLDRIAVALEAQQEMAQLELMLRRVESAERRIDTLEAARVQARTYLGSLAEKRLAAEARLEAARETVKTGWPPGPRSEALQARDEARANLEQIRAEIETMDGSLAMIESRIAGLRADALEWSTMLESRLATLASTPPAAALTTAPATGDSP